MKKLFSIILLFSLLINIIPPQYAAADESEILPVSDSQFIENTDSENMTVYGYLPIGSQYTNKKHALDPPIYIKGESKLTAPPDNWAMGATLGNFGGYLIYKLNEPLQNNPANPYGVDFIVYGNGQGTQRYAEPASIWVAQDKDADGKPDIWYELAGSTHYEKDTLWNYSITYTNSGTGTAYETSDGKTGVFENYQYPDADIYADFGTEINPEEMTLYDTLIDENITPIFGYGDVHPNDAGDIETPLNPYRSGPLFGDKFSNDFNSEYHGRSRGDAMDISWAVDSSGNPVTLDEISFIKLVNSSFVQRSDLGEKSAEITNVVPLYDNAGKEPVGKTQNLDSIIISDGGGEQVFSFEDGKYSYEIKLSDITECRLKIPENSPENVYINNTRAGLPEYSLSNAKQIRKGVYMVRIIAQEGEAEPVLYYLTFTDESAAEDEIRINYNANGGEIFGEEFASKYYSAESFGESLPTPAKNQCKFLGWYDGDKEYTVIDESIPNNITLTAKWETDNNTNNKSKIKVSFRLIGATLSPSGNIDRGRGIYDSEYVTWIPTDQYSLKKGSSVYDLFCLAADNAGIKYDSDNNYINNIKAPSVLGSYRLSEFTNGRRSGWMYTVNGIHTAKAFNEYILKNGDEVIWHYVNDYAYDVSDWGGENSSSLGNKSTWDKWLDAKDAEPEDYSENKKKSDDYSKILTVGKGGSVYPDNLKSYIGKDVVFTITPDNGYIIKSITADGKKAEISNRYIYENLKKTSRIEIEFEPEPKTTPEPNTPIPKTPEPTPAKNEINTQEKPKKSINFIDVPDNHWAAEYIYYLAEKGIISGRNENLFVPDDAVTRAEFIKILANLSGADTKGKTEALEKFEDIDINSWYAPAVLWAAENGIINGIDGSHFAPNEKITREQTAVIIARYISLLNKEYTEKIPDSAHDFNDEDKISDYALSAVHKMKNQGIINGRENNMFRPQAFLTRAETAKIAVLLDSHLK